MSLRTFARIFGIMFLLVGILGFIPGINQMGDHAHHPDHNLVVEGPGHGMLLGLFHVNLLHNLVHVLFGIWGLAASRSWDASRTYARGTAIIYFVLAIAGLIPGLNNMFGLVPLEGNDVWLHFLLAAIPAYFGFIRPATDDMSTTAYNSAGTTRTDSPGVLDEDEGTSTAHR